MCYCSVGLLFLDSHFALKLENAVVRNTLLDTTV